MSREGKENQSISQATTATQPKNIVVDDDDEQHFCLRWNNYQGNMTNVFAELQKNEFFVDVTLACEENVLKAHKVVLSACSTYFQKMLMANPCKHPIIIMPSEIKLFDLKSILEFIYRGEIYVSHDRLQSVLRTAELLKIKGLCDVPGDAIASDKSPFSSKVSATSSRVVPVSSGYKRKLIDHVPSSRVEIGSVKSGSEATHGNGDLADKAKDIAEVKAKEKGDSKKAGCKEKDNVNNSCKKMPVLTAETRLDSCESLQSTRPIWSPAENTNQPINMTGHGVLPPQALFPGHVELPPEPPAPSATPVPCPQEAMYSSNTVLMQCSPPTHQDLGSHENREMHGSTPISIHEDVKVKLEVLHPADSTDNYDSSSRLSHDSTDSMHHMGPSHFLELSEIHIKNEEVHIKEEPGESSSTNGHSPESTNMSPYNNFSNIASFVKTETSTGQLQGASTSQHTGGGSGSASGPKAWSPEDMELALDALRSHTMSLTKASATYGIPSTTLWQRAHRLGIDTPKKEGPTKSWTEENLNSALDALRTGTISANKASKAFGIPSSTLYKIARREGIRLAAPFNAAPTTWTPDDLERALESIRSGQTSVQRASTEFGIPTGTLYGRCKREGIELSRSNPTPWSEDAMGEALEAVRVGQMSINQAAIHYNLPYSSLYGRFKRGRYETDTFQMSPEGNQSMMMDNSNSMMLHDHFLQPQQHHVGNSQQQHMHMQQQQQHVQQQHMQHVQMSQSPQPQVQQQLQPQMISQQTVRSPVSLQHPSPQSSPMPVVFTSSPQPMVAATMHHMTMSPANHYQHPNVS